MSNKIIIFSLTVLKAEIYWALHTVMSSHSARSTDKVSDLFPKMFPDSPIAKEFSIAKDKMGYVITFGLYPFFSCQLMGQVKLCDWFVVSFDETYNNILSKEQMDVVVKFFCEDTQMARTRYLSSQFMGRATAYDIQKHLESALEKLDLKKLLQVSMDGPNTNLRVC